MDWPEHGNEEVHEEDVSDDHVYSEEVVSSDGQVWTWGQPWTIFVVAGTCLNIERLLVWKIPKNVLFSLENEKAPSSDRPLAIARSLSSFSFFPISLLEIYLNGISPLPTS